MSTGNATRTMKMNEKSFFYRIQKLCSREEALIEMKQNLAQYEYFSHKAETASSDIVVFPEDGLTGFEFLDPEYFHPFLQHVPDNYFGWNPCLLPGISYL